MKTILRLFTFVLFVLQVNVTESAGMGTRIPSFAGPVTVLIKQILPCSSELNGKSTFKCVGIIKETRDRNYPRLYGFCENLEPVDDTLQVRMLLASWSNVGGWIPNAFVMNFKRLCTDLRTYFGSLVNILEKHAVNGTRMCPRSVGNFTVDGAPTVYNPSEFAQLPYGRWRGDIFLLRNKEPIGCFRFIIITLPRVKKIDNY